MSGGERDNRSKAPGRGRTRKKKRDTNRDCEADDIKSGCKRV